MFTELKKKIILILIINIKIYSFEDGIIELEVNNFIMEESIPAYFDERHYPTLDLEEFFYATGIKSYEVEGDTVRFKLNGEWITSGINITNRDGVFLVYSGDIGNLFQKTSIKWNPEHMKLSIQTADKLPSEFLAYQEKRRRELAMEEQNSLIQEEWKFLTPGVLNLGYGKSDIQEGNDLLSLNYVNQFIYGATEINASAQEGDFEIDTFRWKRFTPSERKIVLGDSYVRTPSNLGESPSFRGISIFKRNSWDTSLDVNSKRVTGFAPNGGIAELYENGILKEYQIVRNGTYEFEIETTGGSRNYEVWIYKQDGEIEKKAVAVYGTTELLSAGEADYELQLGQDRDNTDFNPYNLNFFYGITEDFTLKLGGYNAREGKREENYINAAPVIRIGGTGRWSHLFTGDFSQNTSVDNEKFYRGELHSGNSIVSSILGYERYRTFDDFFIDESYDEKIYWKLRFPFMGVNTSLSYEREKDRFSSEKLDIYGLTMYDSFFRGRVSASLSLTREHLKREAGKNEYTTEVGTALSYNISNKTLKKIIDTVGVEYTGESQESDTYGIYFHRRSRRDRRLEYYLKFEKEDGESFGEFSVTYKFGEKFNIRSYNYKNRDNSTTHGFDVNTAINFAAPEGKIYYSDYMGDSNILGTVYKDINDNGIRDPGEEGVSGFQIKNSSGQRTTDEEGRFFIPLLSSTSHHRLNIKNTNDDILNYYFQPEYNIRTLPGGNMQLNIPIVPLKSLVGIVEFHEELYIEEVREILKNTSLEITSLKTNKKEVVKIRDEYFIRELPVGKYVMNFIYEGEGELQNKPHYFEIHSSEDEFEEYLEIKISRDKGKIYVIKVTE